MDADRWSTIAGFVGAVIVLSALVTVVGVEDVLDALGSARPGVLVLVLLVAVLWLSAWGLALWTVLSTLGTPMSAPRSILVFTAAVFSNNVTPFGQAGGEPLSALLISQAADSEYETGLAAIASVDTLHFVPSLGLAIGGFTFLAAGAARLGRNLLFAAIAVVVLATALPVGAYLGWRYRYELEATVVRALTPIIKVVGRVVPGRSEPAGHAVADRIEGFFTAIDRVAGDRRALVLSMGFSALGWLALSGALWLSLYALGATVPVSAVVLVVPVAAIAGVTPLPGGSGAIETVLVTLLVPTTGLAANVALSGVLVYRGATYLLPIVIGGGVASILGADRARDAPE
ncbi:lysylphosphatidylglycerol synthase transmembrane domain-containing protein [Haloarculaceae archaeon H-GB2-1]|nr:lysylphosphatidylglycerol synthase transmembrane domain-containing protein [Haloarculaceae archaeon H-GB1-1]MEA5407186.1 lysylphosphatidylglycerol synthase transmembrane domain-containing protein [Haloarculaceae archaeon H-GB2-1]